MLESATWRTPEPVQLRDIRLQMPRVRCVRGVDSSPSFPRQSRECRLATIDERPPPGVLGQGLMARRQGFGLRAPKGIAGRSLAGRSRHRSLVRQQFEASTTEWKGRRRTSTGWSTVMSRDIVDRPGAAALLRLRSLTTCGSLRPGRFGGLLDGRRTLGGDLFRRRPGHRSLRRLSPGLD